jgi:hypothetical protein
MKNSLFILLFVLSVAAQKYPETCRKELNDMKQELNVAKKKLLQQKAFVEHLEEETARLEIELIQSEINQVNQQEVAKQMLSNEQWLMFFYQQRETLNRIIRNNPTCRLEAQAVLDQILTLITRLSDQTVE